MENITEITQQYINIPYLFSFLLMSYGVKNYLGSWLRKITNTKWKTVYTVLIIATVLGLVFYYCIGVDLDTLIISYSLGTSLHELAFWWIEKKIKPDGTDTTATI
jgi:biotin transporter BioY